MFKEPHLIYPPCDTTDLQTLPLDRRLKHLFLVSVAQFRPEKNHRLQLEAYALAREMAGGLSADGWGFAVACGARSWMPCFMMLGDCWVVVRALASAVG